jgi:MFS family permease
MKLPQRGSVLLTTSVASFSTAFMGSALNVALPIIGTTFSIDAVSLGWVATAYTLAIAICLVPFGRASSRSGCSAFWSRRCCAALPRRAGC